MNDVVNQILDLRSWCVEVDGHRASGIGRQSIVLRIVSLTVCSARSCKRATDVTVFGPNPPHPTHNSESLKFSFLIHVGIF